MPSASIRTRDQQLVQIVNAALADSARRSGKWLACKPGCSQCCMGVFAINPLDVMRLQNGLAEIFRVDPDRATRVKARAEEVVARLAPEFPGDTETGLIHQSQEYKQKWNDFAPDEPCPALDPATGTCEVYEYRPITCRVFGPPIKEDGDLAVCELCFDGATDEEIAECEMHPDPDHVEDALLKEIEASTGANGETIIAYALAKAKLPKAHA